MANLVKITDVYLYVGFTEKAFDTYAAIKLLEDEKIKVNLLAYNDASAHQGIFDSLSTWTFGQGDGAYRKEFKDFPILHWSEYYDDWTKVIHAADGLAEIKASTLLANKTLIA